MITYGYSVKEGDDPVMKLVDTALNGLTEAAVPGTFLVDLIPSRESCSLRSYAAGDVDYTYHFLTLLRPNPNPSVMLTH